MKAQNTVRNAALESKSGRAFQYAKLVALSAPGKFLLGLAIMVSLVSVPLLTRADQTNEEKKLTGNWLSTVTRLNPLPGSVPTFISLQTFFEDGNFLEENNESIVRSTGRGHWERIGPRQFMNSFIFFRFDAARNFLGTAQPTTTITLSEDGMEFQGDTVARIYDASGNLLTTVRLSGVAHRL